MWYETGLILVKNGRLTRSSLQRLKDLCYWEDQRLSSLQNLRDLQRDSVPGSARDSRSIILQNLRAIRREVIQLREDLNLPVEDAVGTGEAPAIPEEAYEALPRPLRACCSLLSEPISKDFFLMCVLPLAAASMPEAAAEHAEGYHSAALRVYLVDRSGTAERMMEKVQAYCETSPERVPEVTPKFYPFDEAERNLSEIRERPGVLFSTSEKGTGPQSGGSSETSKAFRTWLEKVFLPHPVANHKTMKADSAIFSGDMESFFRFSARSGVESGLTPYCLVYIGGEAAGWKSQRPDSSSRALNQQFNTLLAQLTGIGNLLGNRKEPLLVELTGNQWEMIDDTFAEKLEIIEELALHEGLKSANRKTALYALKLSIIFSVMRRYDDQPADIEEAEWITPDDDDVIAALWIADTSLKHITYAFDQLPLQAGKDVRGERYTAYFNVLPPDFSTSQAVELAGRMSIADRTAKRYLRTLTTQGKLTRVRRGRYRKVE